MRNEHRDFYGLVPLVLLQKNGEDSLHPWAIKTDAIRFPLQQSGLCCR